jgi:predicted nuclease with TOPRIM domain
MRKLLGIGAALLGGVGVLLCVTAVALTCWAAVATTGRLDRVAARLDHGLADVDQRLSRVEARVNVVRSDLNAVGAAAETIAAENPDLPRVRAQIERLLDRLVPTFERAEAIADSLRSAAAGLLAAADIVDLLIDNPSATVRTRNATSKIERAAEELDGLRGRVEALKLAKAVHLTRELVELARKAIAGSELLADGLTAARQEVAIVRAGTAARRNEFVSWVYLAATASTVFWLWCGLGQTCLIGWGRRQNVVTR